MQRNFVLKIEKSASCNINNVFRFIMSIKIGSVGKKIIIFLGQTYHIRNKNWLLFKCRSTYPQDSVLRTTNSAAITDCIVLGIESFRDWQVCANRLPCKVLTRHQSSSIVVNDGSWKVYCSIAIDKTFYWWNIRRTCRLWQQQNTIDNLRSWNILLNRRDSQGSSKG